MRYYTVLEHEKKWYLLWMRPGKGKEWHIHAIYFQKSAATVPIDTEFWEEDYGSFNRKGTYEEMLVIFMERINLRKSHGYKLKTGIHPPELKISQGRIIDIGV